MPQQKTPAEITLDPDDWEALSALGHQMLDDMMAYLKNLGDGPVWQPFPEENAAQFEQPLPSSPQDAEAVYKEFAEHILPYSNGNVHPRFWGWVMGTGTPLAMLAEMLASGMNMQMGGTNGVGYRVEEQVLDWCKEMLGYPADASGLFVSGGSMANLVGLTVARNAKAGFDVRKEGMQNIARPMIVYGSVEMHSSIQKAVELLGLGSSALHKIPVNDEHEIDVTALEQAVAADRASGLHPFCIVGNAGTVNIGAFDNLDALADVCEREGLWFHVDGAFGALAALSAELEPLVAGMDRADSIAFDLHKWLYLPFEIGCCLVRNEAEHRQTFALHPEYLAVSPRGLAGNKKWFGDYGVQLTRGFRALKAWMSFKTHGLDAYRQLIQQNVDQARYLAARVDETPQLERLAPVPLNIVCFRYRDDRLDHDQLNALNAELLIRLQESGVAAPSNTKLNDCYGLRTCITNHRTRQSDLDLMVAKVVALGQALVTEIL